MKTITNQNGFTYILALTIVMIMGVMLGLVGQSWKTIMQRDREKELLFRGSQIKEAIENWNNLNYTVPGVQRRTTVRPLMDLKDLLQDSNSLSKIHYLPHSYAAEVADNNPKCAPDCAKLKIYQDPMTGKEWTVIRGVIQKDTVTVSTATQGVGIIGVASKSEETPFRSDFKDTALENMGSNSAATTTGAVANTASMTTAPMGMSGAFTGGTIPTATTPGLGAKMTKYSQWQFIADPKNDHSKIYRAYHEGW